MKKFNLTVLFIISILSVYAGAQNPPAYTNITGTLIDGQGQVWSNASWTATIVPPFGNPSPLNNNGLATLGTLSGIADNNGNISLTLDDNTVVKPNGSTWQFTLCPNATVRVCSTSIQVISGTSMNLGASLSNDLVNIAVSAAPTVVRSYVDSQVNGGQGAIYWRTSDNTLRGNNGASWVNIGQSATSLPWSGITSPVNNLNLAFNGFSTIFNLGTTGSSGAAFDITDATNNTGSNYLFRVFTGSGSTAKAAAFCTTNTSNCIQVANNTMNAIGSMQLIATGLINTSPGVGQISFGSNGPGTAGAANTATIGGNINRLYATENGGALLKVLLGSQLTCGTGQVVQSTDTAGNVTCLTLVAPFQVQAVNANTTNFSAIFGIGAFPTAGNTGTEYSTAMPFAATVTGLYIALSTGQPGTGSLVFTLRKNGFDTGLTITVPAGSGQLTWSSTTNVSFIATDLLDVKIVNNASSGSANIVSGLITY